MTVDFSTIRIAHPLESFCESRGLTLRRCGSGGRLVALCPLHQEKTPSFTVYPDDYFYCYGCGAHGDVVDLCAALDGLGYARVSTDDQSTAAQVERLQAAGCKDIYKENASGGRWDRPELHKLLDRLGNGDVLVVWKLDRLSRSLSDLLNILTKLDHVGAGFKSLTEAIDTTTPAGRMMMQMLGSFAEFERAMLKERTKLGLAGARAAGRVGGARSKLSPAGQKQVISMMNAGGKTQTEVAEFFNVHRSTISRLVSERRVLERKA